MSRAMADEGLSKIRKFYEVLGYGSRTGRECYVCGGHSPPPADDEAQWIEDSNFDEAREIRRNANLKEVMDTARRHGRAVVIRKCPGSFR